jgi:hypothetical protein
MTKFDRWTKWFRLERGAIRYEDVPDEFGGQLGIYHLVLVRGEQRTRKTLYVGASPYGVDGVQTRLRGCLRRGRPNQRNTKLNVSPIGASTCA